ncbi:MAG TPA: GNAT family N-acetyltransferase [Methanothrix sp.]|nr:GNAT family N-acetyltransferase [Methanothrix sp.]HPJ84729.1 GNAT family N-acetyltransferase [Methanothrix sp.]HPR67530.1 GNAT family N-acetyltransferase [Methanothrix sp.]
MKEFNEGDIAFIARITKENMAPIIKEAWGLDWDKGFEERYVKDLRSSGAVKIIYKGDKLVGYCWFSERDKENEVFINSIQLEKDYQGKGTGVQVLKLIELIALNRNMQYLSLAVQETNLNAIGVYQRFGFREVSKENGSILMRKKIF